MKVLGVIGGLGPLATAYFMQLIVEMTDAVKDQQHIEVIVHSKPSIPDRTGYILDKSKDNPLPYMQKIEQSLIAQGAEIIAIPCITAHYFQPELEKYGVPVIHAIRKTAEYLKREKISVVGIMATDGTVKSRLFQDIFKEYEIECVIPDDIGQKKVMYLIYENVKAGKKPEMELFESVKKELQEKGAAAVLLGCTELSLIKRDYDVGSGIADVMEVLAQQAVVSCGKLKKSYEHLIT